ncbi:serine protease inhibitor Kazal-type 1-like [Agrilus planipennis]|uniref:Serine protease inhibitor Kazal-type 1-like n=1 Tax=Agrilus planipennis TaxID=224129 RepID=A0A1W4XHZ6_AGRPL|nr:serine protease inhibitor Kazal-type 1-like [Agrilus planipennis]
MKAVSGLLLVVFMALSWSCGVTGSLGKAQECSGCADVYEPVCGVNGKGNRLTFGNACEVDQLNCLEDQDYQIVRPGVCSRSVKPFIRKSGGLF